MLYKMSTGFLQYNYNYKKITIHSDRVKGFIYSFFICYSSFILNISLIEWYPPEILNLLWTHFQKMFHFYCCQKVWFSLHDLWHDFTIFRGTYDFMIKDQIVILIMIRYFTFKLSITKTIVQKPLHARLTHWYNLSNNL